jgi:hypothetical protein
MKILRNILFVLGILLVLFQLFAYSVTRLTIPVDPQGRVWYLIGFNLAFLVGAVFFWLAWLISRKIKRKEKRRMLDDFLK